MKKNILSVLALLMAGIVAASAKEYLLTSPDGRIEVKVDASKTALRYSVSFLGGEVLSPSEISMSLDGGKVFGPSRKFKARYSSKEETIAATNYRVPSFVSRYRNLLLEADGFGVEFRAFDDGVAYRFVGSTEDSIVVSSEKAEFNFSKQRKAYVSYCKTYPRNDGFENEYSYIPLGGFDKDKVAFAPLLVELDSTRKLLITESNLFSYPGMLLSSDGKGNLNGHFPAYPKVEIPYPDHNTYVAERENYIARTYGKRTFPWRVLAIAEDDTQLPVNNMVYALADPAKAEVWAAPGKATWDWWHSWDIYGVDFKSGINNDTYRYYIDYASRNGIEYVLIDAGWSDTKKGDMLQSVPDMDIRALVRYARRRHVGIFLWGMAEPFSHQADTVSKYYARMGIKGFKLDFIDRTDQKAVETVEKIAKTTAKYNMMVDFHGIYKPTGLNRTYPNVINFEGVYGLEQLKGSNPDMPRHDVIIPFTRMVAGPMDYTPGGLRNCTKHTFANRVINPCTQGTRAHQVAEFIVFDSPFTTMADTPTEYMKEKETLQFIVDIPVAYDDTRILQGRVGEYIVTARRHAASWYVGGLTSWTERDVRLPLDFLMPGEKYRVKIFRDGINADRTPQDYKIEKIENVTSSDVLDLHMAPGGGFAIVFER